MLCRFLSSCLTCHREWEWVWLSHSLSAKGSEIFTMHTHLCLHTGLPEVINALCVKDRREGGLEVQLHPARYCPAVQQAASDQPRSVFLNEHEGCLHVRQRSAVPCCLPAAQRSSQLHCCNRPLSSTISAQELLPSLFHYIWCSALSCSAHIHANKRFILNQWVKPAN